MTNSNKALLLEASGKRAHHTPLWLKQRIKKFLRELGVSADEVFFFSSFCKANGWRPDHFGSCESGHVFVDEPYPIYYVDPHKYDDATSQ